MTPVLHKMGRAKVTFDNLLLGTYYGVGTKQIEIRDRNELCSIALSTNEL